MRVFERKNCSSVELTRKVQDKEMTGEEKMRVRLARAEAAVPLTTGRHRVGCDPGRHLPYICVCVCRV